MRRKPRRTMPPATHNRRVERALSQALQRALQVHAQDHSVPPLDISQGRYIIFSDLHRGTRNRADDFRRTERAYNAALAYYYTLGHTLIVLGDAEDLWENRPAPIMDQYAYGFRLEARFHQAGRYLRVWGNHDDAWRDPDKVQQILSQPYLAPLEPQAAVEPGRAGCARWLPRLWGAPSPPRRSAAPPPLQVRESLLIDVVDGSRRLGALFMLHGHQGDPNTERRAWLSKLVVRYLWASIIQPLTGWSFDTPAKDMDLRQKHDRALYAWAQGQDRLILIAGHTHRPVFRSQSYEAQIGEQIERLERSGSASNPARRTRLAELRAELEWVRAQGGRPPRAEAAASLRTPCYFNTGCCCFSDGDITGLEIAEGQIRLVRWPDEHKDPRPQTLMWAPLEELFTQCAAHPAASPAGQASVPES